jgi:CBS domain-containing protein
MPTNVLVKDLMTRDIIACARGADLASVAQILAERRIHAVFVLDDTGKPSGVLSDFDLLAGEWMADDAESLRTMKAMTAGELETSPVEAIGEGEPAAVAAARMRELHLSRLLVTGDDGSAVGVISVSDLVRPLGRLSGERATVGDVMSHAFVSCPPETSLEAAARAMSERRSRSIVAIDERGRTVGVVTGNDLLSLYGPREPGAKVADLMSPPITCEADLPLRDAANLIIRNEVHRLVVTDSSLGYAVPIGIISTSDIVAEMAQEGSVWQEGSGSPHPRSG